MIRLTKQVAALLLLSTTLAAQAEPPVTPKERQTTEQPPIEQQVGTLLDHFHKAMPQDPTQLRLASVRRTIAPAAVPALAALREFVQAHADTSLAARGLEFTIYAAVLDDAAVRDPLQKRAQANDATAKLLLDCANAIQASEGKPRAVAIDAVGSALARPAAPTGSATAPSPEAARCAVQCLMVAGDLSVAEATALAKQVTDPELSKWLTAGAERAAKDPKQWLGKPLELSGKLIGGETFSTNAWRGKVVLVDFWATWCQPCVRSLPELVAAKNKYAAQGLMVVGISSDRKPAALTEFLTAHPELDWPQLYEPGQDGWHPLANRVGITSIPRLFLIDRKGVLRSIDARAKLDELLLALLAE